MDNAMVPSGRLREEAVKRRAADARCASSKVRTGPTDCHYRCSVPIRGNHR